MKVKFDINNRYFRLTFLLMLLCLVWWLGVIGLNRNQQAHQKMKIDMIWNQSVAADAQLRLGNRKLIRGQQQQNHTDSTTLIRTQDGVTVLNRKKQFLSEDPKDKVDHGLQSILLRIKPVCVDSLAVTFRKALEKEGIKDSVAVSYFHNAPGNRVEYSVSDTTLLRKAFATQLIETGVEGEILLRGYVWLPRFCNAENAKALFVGWSCFVLLIGVVFYFIWCKRRVSDRIPVISGVESQKLVYLYNTETRKLTNGDIQYDLPPLSGRLFQKLVEEIGHVVEYDELIHLLWGGDVSGKPKLEQQIKILRKILKDSLGENISIIAISGKGLTLEMKENIDIRIE